MLYVITKQKHNNEMAHHCIVELLGLGRTSSNADWTIFLTAFLGQFDRPNTAKVERTDCLEVIESLANKLDWITTDEQGGDAGEIFRDKKLLKGI